ncbi:MAG: thioesterase family protein [SAR86 cluster bacterium]|uniref:Thioesterase family protein n=1 Tax=SAR86 cluster bacterium TaxID=2030880 RepID=A0A368BNS6_9GAMM|nr:thioesterase [Gammaproteobacteria bacterium]RCL38901.1 MAG: thioesterase family protein [SAR86 cluster bacterium]|tara:strand:- start:13 stop:855 length:843 start_codon:yes stop_codon:yes gene_type:complete
MNQFEQFQAALDLTKVSDSVFSFTPDSRYFVGNTPHGGYLLALMNKAMVQALPHSSAINSNVYYLDRTEPEPAELHVEVLRTSRGSSMGQVKLIQNKKITCLYSSLCSDFEYMKGYSGLSTPLPPIINAVKQDDFKVMSYESLGSGSTPSFIKQLNMSVHPDHAWWDRDISSDAAEARCSAYLELEGGVADTFVLSYLADILPPVVQNKFGSLGWIPTLTLTCNIRQLPKTNLLFIDGHAKDISNGYFEQDCWIWDMDGNLVATSRQLAKILKSEDKISS